MPSQTFFNLSEEKKERLIAGAMKEFSAKSLNDASISNIVKNSKISRGSFYQYFEDKKDLYFYLIGKFRYNYRQLMFKSFKEKEGDFFEGYKVFGEKYIKYIMESEKFGFFENMYLHMNYQINQEARVDFDHSRQQGSSLPDGKRIIDVVDRSQLKVQTEEELIDILRYILSMLNDTIMEGFWKELTVKETQQLFVKRLSWFTYGIKNTEEKEA
ncbi:Transcriptional regulator, TetR family [Alkalibacterium sp. AK22]|uniref:TetR/AcrR family transcriptional regulator n=1 Tax=Alkalibacterium sp. AK22 TaxID=1229520 RepID=UPI00044B334A|nr:TetR/AcrR family transcriptional regulator [Alkalibacterium sp. AK22]EXJ23510.1 Transcriptional regulator, TetR family [Alkalibacterium sp. AK22]